tara:strand:+ start:8500 stop:9210 length:711 start_codon:yes stop_codon:yes gene_type:complete
METKKAIIIITASVFIILFLMILIVKIGPCKTEGFSFEDPGFICPFANRLTNNGPSAPAAAARRDEGIQAAIETGDIEIAEAQGVEYNPESLNAHKDESTLHLKGKLKHINRKLLEYTSPDDFIADSKIKGLINEGCQIKERVTDEDGFLVDTDKITLLQSCMDKYGENIEIGELRSHLFTHIVDTLLICKDHVENYSHLTSLCRRWIQKFIEFSDTSYEDVRTFWKSQNDRLPFI